PEQGVLVAGERQQPAQEQEPRQDADHVQAYRIGRRKPEARPAREPSPCRGRRGGDRAGFGGARGRSGFTHLDSSPKLAIKVSRAPAGGAAPSLSSDRISGETASLV